MPFQFVVELLEPSYQATAPGGGRAEWPPHPARLFCALVAHASLDDTGHHAALGWLERQAPPVVAVPSQSAESAQPRRSWVPTNAIAPRSEHRSLPGRTSGGSQRLWPQRALANGLITFTWAATPSQEVANALREIAVRVPYLGRATGPALLSTAVLDAEADMVEEEGRQHWRLAPAGAGGHRSTPLRVAYPGYLQDLIDAHDAGQPAWQLARTELYAPQADGPDPVLQQLRGPFTDMVIFRFSQSAALDPRHTLMVTSALRDAVLSRLDAMGHVVQEMPSVHGHQARGSVLRSAAYLALPVVGNQHADGLLRAVAVALPAGMPERERRALLAAVIHHDGGLRHLSVAALGTTVVLARVPENEAAAGPRVLSAAAWQRPARVWTSALPMVLDRFPKPADPHWVTAVTTSCVLAGLPEPVDVQVERAGVLLAGTSSPSRHQLRRKPGERPLPGCHVRLTFDRPLIGPVTVGSKRNFGLGLCWPELRNGGSR